jgi:hypothetical protein
MQPAPTSRAVMWLRHRFVKLWRFNGFVLSQSPICDVDMVTTGVLRVNGIFFSLFKQIREMNLDKTYFPYLVLWSRANPIGATYEEVGGTQGLSRAGMPTWSHVDLSRAKWSSMTESHRLLWHD